MVLLFNIHFLGVVLFKFWLSNTFFLSAGSTFLNLLLVSTFYTVHTVHVIYFTKFGREFVRTTMFFLVEFFLCVFKVLSYYCQTALDNAAFYLHSEVLNLEQSSARNSLCGNTLLDISVRLLWTRLHSICTQKF